MPMAGHPGSSDCDISLGTEARSAKRAAADLFSSERECPAVDHYYSVMAMEEQAFLYQSIATYEGPIAHDMPSDILSWSPRSYMGLLCRFQCIRCAMETLLLSKAGLLWKT
jgi:hypothetical protein